MGIFSDSSIFTIPIGYSDSFEHKKTRQFDSSDSESDYSFRESKTQPSSGYNSSDSEEIPTENT